MNIGDYYISKRQIIVFIILFLGLSASVYLVLNRQIFKSRANLVSNYFIITKDTNPPQPAECSGNTCITETLNIVIRPNLQANLQSEPQNPIPAQVTPPAPPTPSPTPTPSVAPSNPRIDPSIGYYIPFRDAAVRVANPQEAKNIILRSWRNAQIGNWDTIVNQSIANGWNPAFVIALWIEESGGQGVSSYSAALGCDINLTKYSGTDINQQLTCLFNNGNYPNDRFADFMCKWGGDGFHHSPCVFNVENPNFPGALAGVYSWLVPSGNGAIIR